MLPTDKAFVVVDRQGNRDELLLRLRAAGAARVYAWLLGYTVKRRWRIGWAAHAFKEIWGNWPNSYRNVEPAESPDCLIEQWVAMRPKRVIKRRRPAPLLEQIEAPPPPHVVNGRVEGTLMTPEDFEVSWR